MRVGSYPFNSLVLIIFSDLKNHLLLTNLKLGIWKMSCSCGSSCGCGSNCKCGKMYPDLDEQASTTTQAQAAVVVVGVAHESKAGQFAVASGEGCKCGSSCTCDPCNC
uniref:Uncharacterized protein n=1 Tax=Avena sativa TaxID=4498 RepID=A0ACD6ARG2_AVESA